MKDHEKCMQGLDECQYTVHQRIEVRDNNGKVVDDTTYNMGVPNTYAVAMAIKYIMVARAAHGGIETFLELLGVGGDPEVALKNFIEN